MAHWHAGAVAAGLVEGAAWPGGMGTSQGEVAEYTALIVFAPAAHVCLGFHAGLSATCLSKWRHLGMGDLRQGL